MSFWKKLFGIKEETIITDSPEIVNNENIVQEQQVSIPTEIQVKERPFTDKLCELCNKTIGLDRYTKAANHYYHKRCFKEQKRKLKAAGKI